LERTEVVWCVLLGDAHEAPARAEAEHVDHRLRVRALLAEREDGSTDAIQVGSLSSAARRSASSSSSPPSPYL
jgi:hypothetical protein